MTGKKSKVLWICTVVIVALTTVYVLVLFPFRSTNALQMSFEYYTNDPVRGPVAVFCATNQSKEAIGIYPYLPQTKKVGVWSTALECTDQMEYWEIYLKPHLFIEFVSLCVTNDEPWRVPVRWHYANPSQFEIVRSRLKQNIYLNWQQLIAGKRPYWFDDRWGVAYLEYSPELTNN